MSCVLGIDPGLEGAFVLTDRKQIFCWHMPTKPGGKTREVDFDGVVRILDESKRVGCSHVILERAMALAMGSSHAFNYGRGFGFLEIALKLSGLSHSQVLPQQWQKEMFEGVSADLKPKARSVIAAERLYPDLVLCLPKKPKGGMHDGMIDALHLANYGLRKIK
jgi:hypothetical protein